MPRRLSAFMGEAAAGAAHQGYQVRQPVTPGAQPSYPRPSLVTTDGRQKPHACASHTLGVDAGEFSAHQDELGGVVDPDQQESIGFSGEVDPPLDGHKIEIGSMVALRCKRGETHLSHLVHLTESVLVIHWREQSPRL